MKPRSVCEMWIFLEIMVLSQLWSGITCQNPCHPGYSVKVSTITRVKQGRSVSIPCTFTANYGNTFTNSSGYWVKKDTEPYYIVASNDKSSDIQKTNFHLTGNPDTGDCTLTIDDARKEDEGEYYFRFVEKKDSKVKFNYVREMITITVTGRELPAGPKVTIGETETLTLVCRADGDPPATVVWEKWSGEADMNATDMSNSGLSAMINVTSSMAGVYRCLAWNAYGLKLYGVEVVTTQGSADEEETFGSADEEKTFGSADEEKTFDGIPYWYLAIAFICGACIVASITLPYILITRKNMNKTNTFVGAKQSVDCVKPSADAIYMNVR